MVIRGGCHCGNIAYTLRLTCEPDPVEIPARACACTFCRKHGAAWTAHPASALAITVRDPAQVSRYEHGTRTATFHVCARCGVPPVVTSEIAGHCYAVVNVNTFEGVDPARLRHTSASFDGEDPTARLDRRRRNWIADVVFT